MSFRWAAPTGRASLGLAPTQQPGEGMPCRPRCPHQVTHSGTAGARCAPLRKNRRHPAGAAPRAALKAFPLSRNVFQPMPCPHLKAFPPPGGRWHGEAVTDEGSSFHGPFRQAGRVWDSPLRKGREKACPAGPDALIRSRTQGRRAHDVRPYEKTEGIPQGRLPEPPLKPFPYLEMYFSPCRVPTSKPSPLWGEGGAAKP